MVHCWPGFDRRYERELIKRRSYSGGKRLWGIGPKTAGAL
jgi:retron-type reverse transcriptase